MQGDLAIRGATFDQVLDAYGRQLEHFVDVKHRGNSVIERLYAEYMPAPFLSLLVSDCIATGTLKYSNGISTANTTSTAILILPLTRCNTSPVANPIMTATGRLSIRL